MDHVHLRLAEIGLRVAARYGFALAGGYAVQAHGILDRPSEDVDLFTAWERRGEFTAAVDAVVGGYRSNGYSVDVTQQFDTFARLAVTDPAHPEHPYKVELAANWRALPPVMMDVGPVLHADDVVAGKMSALYTRAEPRDFLDIDAAVLSGRYTRARLCELAEQSDAGFDRRVLADLFGMMERYPDRRFAAYGAAPAQISEMRKRFAQWRDELVADLP
ncbi:nucleotidyl transferase AbiEii/AbiGii toxin family protein [Micromonospora sp. PLK6-60]|uniref:nucleotidyl transferase AbiEii/AbiGii toxin family protein n=1 Tax=Micromonospora sp. PLK6-60 TaxID=2873383 RepID=UPI001CA72AC7|nr:nucleotidyl transferase AbiEii/AbiGii toxin family protein [Micromonospora sp. PLK6-60]MBY8870807.1 nucleotidyl transferase AbiEii/AbiGii toxin family protein [Micromonospora sp. PLK6-60]